MENSIRYQVRAMKRMFLGSSARKGAVQGFDGYGTVGTVGAVRRVLRLLILDIFTSVT